MSCNLQLRHGIKNYNFLFTVTFQTEWSMVLKEIDQ